MFMVPPIYILVVYGAIHTGRSKWNWTLNRDYWILNYTTHTTIRRYVVGANEDSR
jgi:hypothetical protein